MDEETMKKYIEQGVTSMSAMLLLEEAKKSKTGSAIIALQDAFKKEFDKRKQEFYRRIEELDKKFNETIKELKP